MREVSFTLLLWSALRRLARVDLSGLAGAVHRELRVPTSAVSRRFHVLYSAARNRAGRMSYSGTRQRSDDQSLYLFYDLEVSPITFDFMWSLAAAELRRRGLGLRSLRVVIVPGPRDGGREETKEYDAIFDWEARQWRLWNIVVEICRSLASTCSVTVCNTRAEAEEMFFSGTAHSFPLGYTPNSPVFAGHPVLKAHPDYRKAATFRAPTEAGRFVDRWLNKRCQGRRLVVIVLRQSDHMPDRNSDLVAWRSFAEGLDARSFHVALIPDTDRAMEWSDTWSNTTIVKEACFNLQIRHAFYERSYATMGINCGPVCFASLNPRVALAMFIKIRESVPQATRQFLEGSGFVFGETPVFCTPQQLWIWEDDRLENIRRAFRRLEEAMGDERPVERETTSGLAAKGRA